MKSRLISGNVHQGGRQIIKAIFQNKKINLSNFETNLVMYEINRNRGPFTWKGSYRYCSSKHGNNFMNQ